MLGAASLASRPLAAAAATPRPWTASAVAGEYGWAAWSFSRQAKLNAWAWHGVGTTNVLAWATLGNCMYFRRDDDQAIHIMEPDVYIEDGATSTDSQTCEATTAWLDGGKPTQMKALTGIDADVKNVNFIMVYVSDGGDRDGVLVETIPIGANDFGWTYSGETIPVTATSTAFKLKFVASATAEAQINRVSLIYDEVAG
jgi:hypothetical protein